MAARSCTTTSLPSLAPKFGSWIGPTWRTFVPGQFLLDHSFQGLFVLQTGQHALADDEHRNAVDAGLLVGVLQSPLVRLSVLAVPQGLLERLLAQADFAGQLRQHVDLADVLALDEERFQDSAVIRIPFAVFLGILEALERQVRVRLR